jgi:hypothetical protein
MIILFLHNETRRVVHFTQYDATYLQSLEGTQLIIETFYGHLPNNLTRDNSIRWSFDGKAFKDEGSATEFLRLLHQKAILLAKIQSFVTKVRRPYTKNLHDQHYVYDRKYDEALQYINSIDKESTLRSSSFLADEVEIMKKDPMTTALEIKRVRLERESIYRSSERARRALTEKVCFAKNLQECDIVNSMIIDRNFKLPMDI